MFKGNEANWKAAGASLAIHAAVAALILTGLAFSAQRAGNRHEQRSLQVFLLPADKATPSMPMPAESPLDKASQPEAASAAQQVLATAEPVSRASAAERDQPAVEGDPVSRPDFFVYRQQLMEHIRPFHVYPQAVRSKGLRGVVLVGFMMRRDGGVREAWVEVSSGSGELDTAALSTIRNAQPFPTIPAALPDSLTMTIPLSYATPRLSALQ